MHTNSEIAKSKEHDQARHEPRSVSTVKQWSVVDRHMRHASSLDGHILGGQPATRPHDVRVQRLVALFRALVSVDATALVYCLGLRSCTH